MFNLSNRAIGGLAAAAVAAILGVILLLALGGGETPDAGRSAGTEQFEDGEGSPSVTPGESTSVSPDPAELARLRAQIRDGLDELGEAELRQVLARIEALEAAEKSAG